MKRTKPVRPRFVICIDNSDYPVSLELHKVYSVLRDEQAAQDDYLRVIDESGEDYLYSARRFVPVELPRRVERSFVRTAQEPPKLADKAMQTRRSGPLPHRSAALRTQKTRARRG